MNMMYMLLASGGFWNVWPVIKIIALSIMVICALFIILVVICQPGNSNGVGALGGQTETFLGKNKSKTFEHKMKKLTVISIIILVVCMISFYILTLIKGV